MKLRKTIWELFDSAAEDSTDDIDVADWNQWLGHSRNSEWNETGTMTKFPDDGLKVKWRTEVANGYSGPAVAGGRVFVTDFLRSEGDDTPNPGRKNKLKGIERIHCLDIDTGAKIWEHSYDCDYDISYPNGPRITPTIDQNRVYTIGAEGHLFCFGTEDGKVIWSRDLKKEYALSSAPDWGFAAHPLVFGNKIYCLVGGEGSLAVSFDKFTGKEIWRALSAESTGYCPPTMISAGGCKQLLIWHPESLNSLDPKTGTTYWTVPIKPGQGLSTVAPCHHDDYLLTSSLQDTSVLLKLDSDKPAATEVWRGKGINSYHNPPLIVDDFVYGIDDRGRIRCVDLLTGERKWDSLATAPNGRPAGAGTGFIVKNNDYYYILIETGELILAQMSPEGFTEIDRANILEPTSRSGNRNVVWSHPAYSHKCIFARNDKEIVCISLADSTLGDGK